MVDELSECAKITDEYITALGGGPNMAQDISKVIHPKQVTTQAVYNWAAGSNFPNPFMLYFVWGHTQKGEPLNEWSRRCLIASGLGSWMG